MAQTNPEAVAEQAGRPAALIVTEPVAGTRAAEPPEGELVEDDLLVEDVSIDGMCGVY